MSMEVFHNLFPEIGGREYRVITLFQPDEVPPGNYGFVEAYCTESGCDCRNVLLNVVTDDPPRHLATINYSLDPGGFKAIGMPDAFLDSFNVQTEYSQGLLKLFQRYLLHDSVFLGRLERHLQMVKSLVNKRKGKPTQSRRHRLRGR